MKNNLALAAFVLLMVAVIVSSDFLFFRHHFFERLISNIAIVLTFIFSYSIFKGR